MGDFKVMKELVKALTNVGDAIAGTYKGSNSQGGSCDVYDGILEVADGENITYFSFGIKDNDNATKLGDLFTDNFINDFNNANGEIPFVSTVTKLDNTKIELKAVDPGNTNPPQIYKNGSIVFQQRTGENNDTLLAIVIYGKDYFYFTSLTGGELTKDTPLIKHTMPGGESEGGSSGTTK